MVLKCENAQQSQPKPLYTMVSTPTGIDHTWRIKIEASHTPIINPSFSPPSFLLLYPLSQHIPHSEHECEMLGFFVFLCLRLIFKEPFPFVAISMTTCISPPTELRVN